MKQTFKPKITGNVKTSVVKKDENKGNKDNKKEKPPKGK